MSGQRKWLFNLNPSHREMILDSLQGTGTSHTERVVENEGRRRGALEDLRREDETKLGSGWLGKSKEPDSRLVL